MPDATPIILQQIDLDIVPGKTPPIVHVSEYDTGRQILVNLFRDGYPFGTNSIESYTVKVEGTIGKYGFSEDASWASDAEGVVAINLTEAMTAVHGRVWTKVKLIKSENMQISTCGFWMDVDRAGVNAQDVIEAKGFEDQIKAGVNEYLDSHQPFFTLPEGGQSGQALVSDGNGDAEWGGVPFQLPSGGDAGQALLSDGNDGAYWGAAQSGSGLTEEIKTALLNCFQNVVWIGSDGMDYYEALYDALQNSEPTPTPPTPPTPSDDLLYSLYNQTFDGSAASSLATDVYPLTSDADFVVIIDFTIADGKQAVAYVLSVESGINGYVVNLNSSTVTFKAIEKSFATAIPVSAGTRVKAAYFHKVNSNFTCVAYAYNNSVVSQSAGGTLTTNTNLFAVGRGFSGTVNKLEWHNSLDSITAVKSLLGISGKLVLWELGTMRGSTGEGFDSTTRARNAYFLDSTIKTATAKTGYEFFVYAWDATGTYKGAWTGSEFATESAPTFTTINFDAIRSEYPGYMFRLLLRKTGGSDTISVSEAESNVMFT